MKSMSFKDLTLRNIHQANLSVLLQCFSDPGSTVGTSLPYLMRARVLWGITENDISRWSEMKEKPAKTLGIVLGVTSKLLCLMCVTGPQGELGHVILGHQACFCPCWLP